MNREHIMIGWFHKKPKLSIFLGIFVVLLALLIIIAFKPFTLSEDFDPNPVGSYREALAIIQGIQAEEAERTDLSPNCGTTLMTHGQKVENVIVFLHGFTSCPVQFAELGEAYFEQGYNIYIPRQPHHGLQQVKGTPLKELDAPQLAAYGSQAVDVAHGLGERIIVVGLSGGGAVATWLGQERSDIDLIVPIAPFLGIHYIPRALTRPLTNLILAMPNFFLWWDPEYKMDNPLSSSYSYRGYYTHALFGNLKLGFIAEREAKRMKPAAGGILVITNEIDPAVNNEVVAEFEALWIEHGEQFLSTYQFPGEMDLPHDIISPTMPKGRIDLVYPKLLELIQ